MTGELPVVEQGLLRSGAVGICNFCVRTPTKTGKMVFSRNVMFSVECDPVISKSGVRRFQI